MATDSPAYEDLLRAVTDLKKQLAAEQNRYRTIFEQAGVAISLIDMDGHFFETNKEFCRQLGYSREELTAMTMAAITSEQFKHTLKKRIKLIQEQGALIFESEHVCRDSRLVPVELNSRLIEVDHRKVILTISRDISRRKQIERCQLLEHDRFCGVLEAIPEGIYIVNQQYDIEYVNPAIVQEFGVAGNKKCFHYMHNRDTPCPACKNKEVFKGKTVRRTWHSRINDKHYEITDSLLKSVDDTPAKVVFFHDITKEQQTKALLEKNRVLLESIINNSGAIVYLKDVTGRYLLVNKLFNDFFNPQGLDIIGRNDFDIFPPEQARTLQHHDQQVLASGRVQQFEDRVSLADGTHVYLTTKFTIVDSDNAVTGIAGISTDITRRKQLEIECLQQKEQLLALINASPNLTCIKDGKGRVLLANETYRQIFQFEKEQQYVNKTDVELASLYPDFAEIFLACGKSDEECWQKGRLLHRERSMHLLNGKEIICEVVKTPLFHPDGTRKGIVVQWHDITRLRRTEQVLRCEIKARKLAARVLQKKSEDVEEANAALRVLIRLQKKDVAEHQQYILSQLERAVFPYLELLEQYLSEGQGLEYLNTIRSHLRNMGDSFIKKLDNSNLGLTKKEILVADLVKQGKRTREIAQLLGLQPRSIEAYRSSIRKKLHINQKKIGLAQYLQDHFTAGE